MYRQRKVAVVIPAYNVGKHVEGVIKDIPEFVDDIIVVEDASTDETADVLRAVQDPRLTVLHHSVNQGVGAAMVTGFRVALERDAEVVVKLDGDGQMDPHYLPALLDPILLEGHAYAKGNRFLDEEELDDNRRIGFYKILDRYDVVLTLYVQTAVHVAHFARDDVFSASSQQVG